jgi:hypothetical protein
MDSSPMSIQPTRPALCFHDKMEAADEEGHAGHGIGGEGHPERKEDRGSLTAR